MTGLTVLATVLALGAPMEVTSHPAPTPTAPIVVQGPQQSHQEHHAAGVQQTGGQAQEAQATETHDQMMARAAATNAKLTALVGKVNAATGQAKVDAIAELLTALVEERTAGGGMMMQGQMMGPMMQHMMGPMMRHMQGTAVASEAGTGCSMMKTAAAEGK